MKFTVEVDIDRPIKEVIEKFDNQDNYSSWMKGLESFENIEGKQGQEGAKTKFNFKMGKRNMEMIETVLKRELPKQYLVSYEVNGVYNEVDNRFEKIDNQKTLYTTHQYFEFKGFMRFLAFFIRGSFKKQSLKYANDFKKFVENDGLVSSD
ncbi:MAG: SRPBCC family protein [Brumimicrobium sp.]